MNYSYDDLVPISALAHFSYCPRRCALIHIERAWVENLYTAEGRVMHERVDSSRSESRGDVRLAFGLALCSLRLGLTGKADVVEFHREKASGEGARLGSTLWRPFPVEHKRGRPKKEAWDRVQLCAQAMCLEEMLGVDVPKGALFYGKTRRREDVVFDAELRRETEETARRLHDLIDGGVTPPPVYTAACERCSFVGTCLPRVLLSGRSAQGYLKDLIGEK